MKDSFTLCLYISLETKEGQTPVNSNKADAMSAENTTINYSINHLHQVFF